MSEADKRTVFTDALHTLGTIISENEKRDAIHIAVEPVVAGHDLKAGDRVGRLPDGSYGFKSPMGEVNIVGIVDPWLEVPVRRGQRFWLAVNPRTITSLRHVWDHPDFPHIEHTEDLAENDAVPEAYDVKAESRKWMEDYAEKLNQGYQSWYDDEYSGNLRVTADELIEEGTKHITEEWHYFSKGPLFESVSLDQEFWFHLSVLTGLEIPESKQESFFSCSC